MYNKFLASKLASKKLSINVVAEMLEISGLRNKRGPQEGLLQDGEVIRRQSWVELHLTQER